MTHIKMRCSSRRSSFDDGKRRNILTGSILTLTNQTVGSGSPPLIYCHADELKQKKRKEMRFMWL